MLSSPSPAPIHWVVEQVRFGATSHIAPAGQLMGVKIGKGPVVARGWGGLEQKVCLKQTSPSAQEFTQSFNFCDCSLCMHRNPAAD